MTNASRNSFETPEICLKLPHFLVVYTLALLGFGFLVTSCYMAYLVDKTHKKIKRLEMKVDYLVRLAEGERDVKSALKKVGTGGEGTKNETMEGEWEREGAEDRERVAVEDGK